MKRKGLIAGLVLSTVCLMPITAKAEVKPPEYPPEYTEVFAGMTAEDEYYLYRAVMCEAGNTNLICCEGTVCIILNRVLSEDFPDTVTAVVNQPGQFLTRKAFNGTEPNDLVYQAVVNVREHGAKVIRDELAYQGWDFTQTDYVFFATKKQSLADNHIWIGVRTAAGKPLKGQGHWCGTERK